MARLEIRKLKKVSRIEIGDRPITIGRSSGNDVVLRDERVSRRHCVIEMIEGLPRLRDLESHTGTFVNGTRITEAELSHRDRVSIGPFDLVYRDSENEFAIHSDASMSADASAIGDAADTESNGEAIAAQREEAEQLLAAQTQQIAELTAAAAALHGELESKSGQITTLRSEMESLIQRQRNTEATRQTALERINRAEDQMNQLHDRIDSVSDAVAQVAALQQQIANAEHAWAGANEKLESQNDEAARQNRDALSARLDSLNRQRESAIADLERHIAQLRSAAANASPGASMRTTADNAGSRPNASRAKRSWQFGVRRGA